MRLERHHLLSEVLLLSRYLILSHYSGTADNALVLLGSSHRLGQEANYILEQITLKQTA
jgi:hypothetical protein